MLMQLAINGLLLALLPLALVWTSSDKKKYRKLVWVTLFLTFDLIMFGAFTRLTDSGLGCPDWPGCYGQANPWQAQSHIQAAELALPSGPVTFAKAWIEMIHRYLAMAVGVLCIVLMIAGLRIWHKASSSSIRPSPSLAIAIFFCVCVQGAFGAWTVTLKLQPLIVTIHLLLGMVLLGLLAWLATRQEQQIVAVAALRIRWSAAAALILLLIQIGLGGWVSTNYATLACNDYPLCHGKLVPSMDLANGFSLWRDLGKTATGEFLPFPALTAIHWVHRSFAYLVIACIAWVACRALKIEGLYKTARALLVLIGVQFLTGVSTIFFNWPLAIAVAHNGGAALLLLVLVMLNYKANLPRQRHIIMQKSHAKIAFHSSCQSE
ncbi:MAG: COX15/CtaA family protein [Pseudomonadota bacterium]